ncbi:MAG: DNA adenine methylase [Candidatus Thorarchaeota archaeon]
MNSEAKPFLKWAGGKTQLLDELILRLPESVKSTNKIERYIEPFIGGGAMFFYLKNNYQIKKSYLFDINKELVLAYNVIKEHPAELIKLLLNMKQNYLKRDSEKRRRYYYKKRDEFNEQVINFDYEKYNYSWIIRTAHLIFLNKTCFNGLFRQNRKGEFNVPHGSYKNPSICDKENIFAVSKALENTEIIFGDFEASRKYVNKKSFIYLDPPYRPLNGTANFTSYNKDGFTEEDQKRLAKYYKEMSKRKAQLMLSNSDPTNEKKEDRFFDRLYSSFHIDRVLAKRIINCDASKRGEIRELIITN